MFPIIPSHILSQSPASTSTPSSLVKYPLANSNSCDTAIWNIWTEDLIRRRYLLSATESLNPLATPNCASPSTRRHVKSDQFKDGCFAACPLTKDTKSRRFDDVQNCDRIASERQMVTIDAEGFLKIVGESMHRRTFWVKSLNVAHDTYSNNAQLEISGDRKLRLKIVKNIGVGDEVLLWFSEEILAIMGVPFLTPANIQGKNCYRCTECKKIFENPNPLKFHIATKCERNTQDDLWHRLFHLLPTPSQPQWTSDAPQILRNYSSSPPTQLPIVQSYHSSHQLHRFPLFQSAPLFIPSPYQMPSSQPPSSTSGMTPPCVPANSDKVVAAAAAQLETIVSNMGTSKQGHICIYCGKLYSRKYGLKIHIRTHTGFKPLKCKYCLRPFGDPSNLNKHIRLHVQEKSLYKCNVCTKILVRRRDLLRHMNIKHNKGGSDGGRRAGDNDSSNGYNDEASSPSEASANGDSHSSSGDDNDDVEDEEFEMLQVD